MLSEMKAAAGETDIHMGGEKRTETLQGRGNRHTLTALLYETLVDKAQGEKYPRDKGDEVLCIILGLKTVPSALCVPMASLSAACYVTPTIPLAAFCSFAIDATTVALFYTCE